MGTWPDHKETARQKGVLAKEFFMVRTIPKVGTDELKANLAEHLAYQKELETKGILVLAGPLSDDKAEDWSGEGLIIYRASSLAEARTIADADPMHRDGLRTYEIRAWLLNEGALQVGVSLSDQSITFS